jgi:hypothetical protein
MNFNRDTFQANLDKLDGVDVAYDSNRKTFWNQWSGTTGTLQQELTYNEGGYTYRSWSPETSAMNSNLGMLVSLKIDSESGIGDDHIILLTGFMNLKGQGPTMVLAQASVQFHGDDSQNIMGVPVKYDPNSTQTLDELLYDDLQQQINDCGFTGDNAGRNNLATIAKLNVQALMGSVSA